MKRVTVRVVGGLGNQLHCYAIGRAIAEHNGARLCVDCESGYWADPYGRAFLLDEFPHLWLNKADVPASSIGKVVRRVLTKAKSAVGQFLPIEWRPIVVEPRPYRYRPEIHNARYRVNPYLIGYWATYRYYDEVKEQLLKELSPPRPQNPAILRTLEVISSAESCAIHWRSYTEESHVDHPSLAMYYEAAVAFVRSRHPSVRFFVFSDNHTLAKKALVNLGDTISYIDLPEAVGNRQSMNDFYLMYACKHAIIGDSTFSWWAAWLSDKVGKTVVAPGGISPWGIDWAPSNWKSIPIDSVCPGVN